MRILETWTATRLKDICDVIQYGYTESASTKVIGPKFLRITDIVPYFVDWDTVPYCRIDERDYEKYKLHIGDIVIARTGATTGYNTLIKKDVDAVFASYLIRFRLNAQKADFRYIGHLLKSQSYYGFINCAVGGAAQPGINATVLSSFSFMLPHLSTQTRIANILSTYDNAIENNNRRIALLEKAARELYREWFVRMRFPGYEYTKIIGGLPKGWKVKRLEEFCHVTDGTHDPPKRADSGVPLVTGKCINNGFIDFNAAYLISEADHMAISRRSGLSSGDILISNIGTVGSICIVEYNREFSVKNVIILKPKCMIKSSYLYYLMTSSTMQDTLSAQTNGASQQFVGLTFMRRFKILIPNKLILKCFAEHVSPILKEKQILHTQSQNLARQRDLLLPRLMSGKLKI